MPTRRVLVTMKDYGRCVERVYCRLYGRAPTAEEVSLARAFTDGGVETSRCVRYAQGLLLANEFVFID